MARKKREPHRVPFDASTGVMSGYDKEGNYHEVRMKPMPPGASRPAHPHGPQSPAKRLSGVAHLRQVMHASDAVSIEQLCAEAALRIVELQDQSRPRKW